MQVLAEKACSFFHIPNRIIKHILISMIQFSLSPPSFVCVYHELFTK
jgi:hypothetical protein